MIMQIQNIDKEYGSGDTMVRALTGVNFSIQPQDFIAVCGPSGSGKTTLLTIIAGLNHPTRGEVIIDDISIYKELNSNGLANYRNEYIGFVFQAFQLIPYLTALENVILPLAHQSISNKEKRNMAVEALERVDLSAKLKSLPGELSGGQRQRVAIARAIVNNPRILLADEPTGNLDTKTRDKILALFDSIKKFGHTVIMVTHDPINLQYAARTIRIEDGQLV